MAGLSERQPQEHPGQKPPRKGIARILGRGQRNPFSNMTPTDAKPTPGYSPLTGTDRSSADSLHQIAAEARARVEENAARALQEESAATIDNSSPTLGFWDRRVSKKAAVIAGSVIALVGAAGLGAEAVVVNNNSSTDKANTTDAGDSANPTPPSLITPDGKNVVIPGTSATSGTASSIVTETHATPTPEKPKTVEWTLDQIKNAQQDALANNRVALLDTWTDDEGEAKDAKNFKDLPIIAINYARPEGKAFNAPFSGKVSGISVTVFSDGTKLRNIFMKVGGIEMEILVDFNSQILVQNDQIVTVGTPISTLSGDTIPSSSRVSESGQVLIFNTSNFDTTTQSVLKDSNGIPVRLPTIK